MMTSPTATQHKHNHTIWIINAINAIFFAGYLVLKFPLAYILAHQGFPLTTAYSLTTTCTIAFAFCSLLLSNILKHYHDHKHILFISLFFILISACMLTTAIATDQIMGLAFYVLGGSLYFFNMTLLINKQFHTPTQRLTGNYISQIVLNLGGFFGTIAFLFSTASDTRYFHYSIALILISILLLLIFYHRVEDSASTWKEKWFLYSNCFIVWLIAIVCLEYNEAARYITVFAFLIALFSVTRQSIKTKDHGYFAYLVLILLFSLPLWISSVIFYNQFFIFLHDRVLSCFHLPATSIILLDPLGNMVFGILWYRITQSFDPKPYFNLLLGLILITTAFFILWMGLSVQTTDKLAVTYPILSILFFSFAQFLIQPTMQSKLSNMIKTHQHRVTALGILRSIRAVAAIIAFYLIQTTASSHPHEPVMQNSQLYLHTFYILCAAMFIFLVFRKRLNLEAIVDYKSENPVL